MKTEEILKQRGKIHGDYSKGLNTRSEILDLLKKHSNGRIEGMIEVGFLDIINKLVRASSNPDHLDNWDDLAGYSMLMKSHMEKYPGE